MQKAFNKSQSWPCKTSVLMVLYMSLYVSKLKAQQPYIWDHLGLSWFIFIFRLTIAIYRPVRPLLMNPSTFTQGTVDMAAAAEHLGMQSATTTTWVCTHKSVAKTPAMCLKWDRNAQEVSQTPYETRSLGVGQQNQLRQFLRMFCR